MTDYKQLCAELLRYWDDAPTPSDFIDTNGYGTIQRIRAALAKSESSGDVTDGSHLITPPPELVKEWVNKHYGCRVDRDPSGVERTIATKAARWGADQELEACCEWLSVPCPSYGRELRNARRLKPPSLKEQALAELELLRGDANAHGLGFDAPAIRRALEQLND